MLATFWWLLVGHALCDYPLQNDFLAKGKNHRSPLPGIPWYQCLFGHCVIHGGAVALVTGSVFLGVAETLVHGIIDHCKCEGRFGFNFDQVLHIWFKVLWASWAMPL
jgi:hypothetical protein